MRYGLTTKGVRKFLFQCGKANKIVMPQTWFRDKCTSKEW